MGVQDHADGARRDVGAVRCFVLTVSDSRAPETDESGRVAAELIEQAGHAVAGRRIVPNDRAAIVDALRKALESADLVLALGGTGISQRDVTIEAARELIEKELPGFGELFRSKSIQDIGTAAILSRATLGSVAGGKLVAVTPGSPGAVRLALSDVLLPQLKHLVRELRK